MLDDYVLADGRGIVASADPRDYPSVPDSHRFTGLMLVRKAHPYWTRTDRVVMAPRMLKTAPRLRDLRRLSRAVDRMMGRDPATAAMEVPF